MKHLKPHTTNVIYLTVLLGILSTCSPKNNEINTIELELVNRVWKYSKANPDGFQDHTSAYENNILSLSSYKNTLQAEFVLSSDQFVNTSSPFYQKFKDYNCLFEMEAYAIASVAGEHSIPFYCLKVVSDNCDGTDKDWENILHKIRPEIDKAISSFCKEMLH